MKSFSKSISLIILFNFIISFCLSHTMNDWINEKGIGSYKNGKKEGRWITYWENSSPPSKKLNVCPNDGFPNTQGKFKYCPKCGESFFVKQKQGNSLDNIILDEVVMCEGNFINDKKQGEWVFFNTDGTLRWKGEYKNDKKNGKWIYFFNDSKIKSEGYYKDDKKNGDWIIYKYDKLDNQVEVNEKYLNGDIICNDIIEVKLWNKCYNIENTIEIDLSGHHKNHIGNLNEKISYDIGRLKNLEILNLSYNQINGKIPKSIGDLKNLRELKLHYNNLSGEIPKEIGHLKKIKKIELDHNNLSGSIPSILGRLYTLKKLHLHENNLSGLIPNSLCNLNLNWSSSWNGKEFSYLYGNKLCGPYPNCSKGKITTQQKQNTSYCP